MELWREQCIYCMAWFKISQQLTEIVISLLLVKTGLAQVTETEGCFINSKCFMCICSSTILELNIYDDFSLSKKKHYICLFIRHRPQWLKAILIMNVIIILYTLIKYTVLKEEALCCLKSGLMQGLLWVSYFFGFFFNYS